jgi:hypothetical protein
LRQVNLSGSFLVEVAWILNRDLAMPRPKRRFEALEDRRLLAAWGSPSTPASSAAEVGPISTANASPAGSTAASSASNASSSSATDTTAYDNYSDYAPAVSSPGGGSSNGYSYASPSSSYYNTSSNDKTNANEYAASNEYTSNYNDSSKTSPTSHATNLTTPVALTAPATTSGAADVQLNASSAGSFALLATPGGQGPSAATSPPAARTAFAPLVAIEGEPGVTWSEAVASPNSLTESELEPPVALASYEKGINPHNVRQPAAEELVAQAEYAHPPVEFGSGPIAELSGINLAAIERGIDEVFDRIERLGDEWAGEVGATRFAEWLVIAGGACAAFEYVRARYREVGPWQAVGGWPIFREPRLRRRWFPPRSAR